MKRLNIRNVKKETFFRMPKGIYNFELTCTERELYMLCYDNWNKSLLNNWVNNNGDIYFKANQDKISEVLRISKRTVIRSFNRLIELGLLEKKKRGGKGNIYYLMDLSDMKNNFEIDINDYENLNSLSDDLALKIDKKNKSANISPNNDNSAPNNDNASPNNDNLAPVIRTINNNNNKEQYNKNKYISSKDETTDLTKTIEEEKNKKQNNVKNEIETIKNKWEEFSNRFNLPGKNLKLNETRKLKIKKLLKEFTVKEVLECLEKVKSSSFLMGNNDKRWEINFDFFINYNNFIKIFEDNYTDKKGDFKHGNGNRGNSRKISEPKYTIEEYEGWL